MLIRAEKESDISAVRSLNEAAFQRPAQADWVEALRRHVRAIVSLVAEKGTTVVGQILFSPVSLEGWPDLKIMGLALMALASQHQPRRGRSSFRTSALARDESRAHGAFRF